jgi:endonuclease/exonuclease/phosphatase (EEP) superfamily protein YafD
VAVAVAAWLYLAVILGLWALLRAADIWWPATLLMFSPRWLLALPGALLLPAAAVLRRRSLLPLLLTLVLIAGPVMGFCVPWRAFGSADSEGMRLRVLTCNMHYQRHLDPELLDRLIDDSRPDVVTLQEWDASNHSEVLTTDGWHVRRTPRIFLASRYPIRQAKRVGRDSMDEKGSVMRYELETPAGVLTLFSLHLASPRKGLSEVTPYRWQGPADLRAGSDLRREQCANLAREADDVAGPVLLAGDFNTPPESVLFREVFGRYTDAFSAAGWGWGYTFIGGRTTVRIDHILAGPGWRCDRCWIGPNVGSPHRPVIADLTWPATATFARQTDGAP